MGAYASMLSGLKPTQVIAANVLDIGNRAASAFTGLVNTIRFAPYIVSLLVALTYALMIFVTFAMPYIILGIVIYLIYCACNNQSAWGNAKKTNTSKSDLWIQRQLKKADPKYWLSHDTKIFINSFGGDKKPKTTPRPLMKSGRCDNISFVEDSPQGVYGHCESTKIPDDIIFDIDQSQIPEFISLPANLKKVLEPRLHIKIPYTKKPEESFYVPQCDKATYSDGTAVDLYDEAGMSCKLMTKSIINTNLDNQDKNKGYYVDKGFYVEQNQEPVTQNQQSNTEYQNSEYQNQN